MAQLWRQNSKDDSERLCLIDFVHPDSPVLKSVIITAKERMAKITGERWGKAVAELPAYLPPSEWTTDPKHTLAEWVSWEVEALYEMLRERKISYAVEKWDSAVHEQVIRTPEELLSPGELGGPCIDLVLLLASCLEYISLHSLITVLDGPPHAILGYWLGERLFCKEMLAAEVRPLFFNWRELEREKERLGIEIAFVECTGLTVGEDWSFSKAKEEGENRYRRQPIRFCLDVKAARETALSQQIRTYLQVVRERLGRLPQAWYPSNADFSQVRVRVQVRRGRRAYSEAEERERERLRREGIEVKEEGKSPYSMRGILEKREQEAAARPLDWDSQVRKRIQRGAILGDPGFGKTWLLKYEGWHVAGESLNELEVRPLNTEAINLPIYVPLANLANTLAELKDKQEAAARTLQLEDALIAWLKDEHQISDGLEEWIRPTKQQEKGLLNAERCLLLLDGLDEVPLEPNPRQLMRGYRNDLCKRLSSFADKYRCRIWLTSRSAAYQAEPFRLSRSEGQGEFELLPFDRGQQEAFSQAWFARSPDMANSFLQKLRSAPQILGLGQVPLLLAMLCKVFENNQFQLPTRRADLYESCLNGLLRGEWKDSQPQVSEAYLDAKRELAEELAYHLFDQEKELFYIRDLRAVIKKIFEEQPELREDLGNKRPVELIDDLREQDGLLIKAWAGENPPYLFLHLTFQEYLTACALAGKSDLVSLNGEEVPEWLAVVKPHFFNPRWEEVIRLLSSKLEDATPLVQAIWEQPEDILFGRLFLTAKCLTDAQHVQEPLRRTIIEEVLTLMKARDRSKAVPTDRLASLYLLVQNEKGAFERHNVFNFERLIGMFAVACDEVFEKLVEMINAEVPRLRFDPRGLVFASGPDHKAERTDLVILSLGMTHDDKAVPYLIKLLEQPDRDVRAAAAWALGEIGSEKAIPALVEQLTSSHSCDRDAAEEALRKIGSVVAVPYLIELLKGADLVVEESWGWQGKIGDGYWSKERAVASVKSAAMEALGATGSEKAVPFLIELLGSTAPGSKTGAVRTLWEIGSKQVVPALVELLGSSDPDERKWAAAALGETRSEEVVPALVELLGSSHADDRAWAAQALGKIGCESAVHLAVPALVESFQSIGYFERRTLARILAKLFCEHGEGLLPRSVRFAERVMAALEELLSSPYPEDRVTAVEALERIGRREAEDDLILLLRSSAALSKQDRTVEVWPIEHPRKAEHEHVILARYRTTPSKEAIAWALGRIGSKKAVPLLIKLLQHPSRAVKKSAARALGQIRSIEAAPHLLKLLQEAGRSVKKSAAAALAEIGSEEAVPHLIKLLQDPRHCLGPSYMRVVELLGPYGSRHAIPPLYELVMSRRSNSKSALRALRYISRTQGFRIHLDGTYTEMS